jgi:hypothetical protein
LLAVDTNTMMYTLSTNLTLTANVFER